MSDCQIITKQDLIDRYLFGLKLSDDQGNPFPDAMWEQAIAYGISTTESKLDIKICETQFVGDDVPPTVERADGTFGAEVHDFYPADDFSSFELDCRPIFETPTEVRVVYEGADQPTFVFPQDWIRMVNPNHGMLSLIPSAYSAPILVQGGTNLFVHLRGITQFPALLRVDYKAGFPDGKIPADIIQAVSLHACQNILNPAGDLIVGAGIASKSLSIGGLSQSINTTSSATNAGYGSRLIRYDKELKDLIPSIRRRYHGLDIKVI